MSDITKWERPKDQMPPREIRITLPRIPRMPKDKLPMLVAIASGTISCIFVLHLLDQIKDLKKQQNSAEQRIKDEVLMPGGTNSYKTEFKPDPNVDTANDKVTVIAEPVSTPAPEPVTAPAPAPAPSRGPGNLDSGYSPSYSPGPSGPGNM